MSALQCVLQVLLYQFIRVFKIRVNSDLLALTTPSSPFKYILTLPSFSTVISILVLPAGFELCFQAERLTEKRCFQYLDILLYGLADSDHSTVFSKTYHKGSLHCYQFDQAKSSL